MFNPSNNSQQANFLALNSAGAGSASLVPFGTHKDGSAPFNNNNYPADPVMQFMGPVDQATTNGSEQIYLPAIGGGWRPSTKVCVYDPTQSDVPTLSPGSAAVIAYGKGYGDNNRGWVMYEGGHSQDKGGDYSVAAQRAFLNFSYMATLQKSMNLSVSGIQSVMVSNVVYNLSVTIQQSIATGPYTIQWSSSCGGTFSNPTAANTTFTPPLVGAPSNCVVTVKVTDACNRTKIQTFTVLITSGPRPPVALPDSLTFSPDCINVNPSIQLSPLANDVEPDGQPMTISSVTGTNGTWTINGGQTITFVPNTGFYGSTTVNYTVCDNTAPTPLCTSSTIKITITSAITPPTAVNDNYSIYEDSVSVFSVLTNDLPSGGGLKVAGIPIMPKNGKVSINIDNTISYLPNADYNGLDSFYYKISTTGGYFSTAMVRIIIVHDCCSPGNYKKILGPIITTTQTLTATEDTYLKLKAATTNFGTTTDIVLDRESTDKHVGILKFDLSNLICYATLVRSATLKLQKLSGNDQAISLYRLLNNWTETQATWNNRLTSTAWSTPGGDYNPSQLIDATGTPVSNIFNWNATGILQNMVCSSYLYPNYGFIIRVDETGGNRLTIFASRENNTAGVIKPSLQVTFDSAAFICVPIPVRAPLAIPDTSYTNSNISTLINVLPNDQLPGSNTGTISLISASVITGTATIVNNKINYVPSGSFQGITSFQYIVTDNTTNLKDTANVYVYVTYPPPIANNDSLTILSGESGSRDILANDIDQVGFGLTTTILSGPKYGSMTQSGTTITFTAPFNFYGRDTITYRIANMNEGSCNQPIAADTAYFIIIVLNRPPVAVNDNTSTNPCQPITIDVLSNDSDPENGSFRINSVSLTTPGTAGFAYTDGTLIYFNPNTDYAGTSATFTYTIADDATPPAISNPATVSINLAAISNLPPDAINDSVTGLFNAPIYINSLDNDSDPENDLLTITLLPQLLQPKNGTVSQLANGLIVYTPHTGFSGRDSFDYKLSDSHFGPSGGSCTSVSQSKTARVYILITNLLFPLTSNQLQLTGFYQNQQNLLKWTVQENDIPVSYVIEKSIDNSLFQPIATINKNNPGFGIHSYTYSDVQSNNATFYYRIKMIKINQFPVYSNTILIKNNESIYLMQVYEVPFNNQLKAKIFAPAPGNIEAYLINIEGKILKQLSMVGKKEENLIIFDNLEQLPAGFYLLSIFMNGQNWQQKIIKSP
jgi:hypothetical protein